jgi:hypothetical protein
MQKQNVEEYKLIRKEISELKSCITTYMGFVIGGSGAVFVALTAFKEIASSERLVYALEFSSIFVTLVMTILFYKFNSHNRFAGYCKLLNQEVFGGDARYFEQFISWEKNVEKLRERDSIFKEYMKKRKGGFKVKKSLYSYLMIKILISNVNPKNKLEIDYKKLKAILKPRNKVCQAIYGFFIFFNSTFLQKKYESWNYPFYVVLVFFTINFMLLFVSSYLYCKLGQENCLMMLSLYSVITCQVISWLILFFKLFDLIRGKTSIEAYCYRFLPFRKDYVQKHGVNYYIL